MFLLLYQILLSVILILALPALLILMLTQKHYRAGLRERLGIYKKKILTSQAPVLWIHGSSVGEIQTILPFLGEIKLNFPQYQLLFSATTMTGINLLKSKKLDCLYFPVDLTWIVKKAFRAIQPNMIWILETELWPSFIDRAKKKKIPLFLINGRLSDPSFKRYRLLHFGVKKMLNCFDQVLVQTKEDLKRFIQLGLAANKCAVTGNIKFDAASLKKPTPLEIKELNITFGVEPDDLIWVAGSTHGEEEKICAEIYLSLRKNFHSLRLMIAPRHLTRVKEVEKTLKNLNLNAVSRSKLNNQNNRASVILLDTLGELYKIYALADVVFIGRSLDGFGGQNPLEAAIFAKPILFGPHMENFRQSAGELLTQKGAFCVENKEKLEEKIQRLLKEKELRQKMGQNAVSIFSLHQGASQETWNQIKSSLRLDSLK